MKRYTSVFNFAGGAAFALLILSQISFKNNTNSQPEEKPVATAAAPEWRAPAIPEQLSFAGEAVPLDRWDIQERFDREFLVNTYNPANILILLKRSGRYFPVISDRLKANGVPDDFKYLCIAESNLWGIAVSRSGAVGYWQFMNGTAPGYGLETTSQVDQRMDIAKSTDAACKYLKQAYARFGSWTAAAASYNCGMGGYNKQATFQRTKNYYDLQLPEETNRYIYRILAFKYVFENADALGFKMNDAEKYDEVPHRVVNVTSSIPNLADFAIQNGTTYKILRLMNPWLKSQSLTVSRGKSYNIRLPIKSS